MFLVASADELPGPLAGRADRITISLPWGTLLRSVLNPESPGFGALVSVARACAKVEILVSSTERDATSDQLVLDEDAAAALAARYAASGFRVDEWRPASAADVARLSSGWGRRLGIPQRRRAWLYRLVVSCDGGDTIIRAQREEA